MQRTRFLHQQHHTHEPPPWSRREPERFTIHRSRGLPYIAGATYGKPIKRLMVGR